MGEKLSTKGFPVRGRKFSWRGSQIYKNYQEQHLNSKRTEIILYMRGWPVALLLNILLILKFDCLSRFFFVFFF